MHRVGEESPCTCETGIEFIRTCSNMYMYSIAVKRNNCGHICRKIVSAMQLVYNMCMYIHVHIHVRIHVYRCMYMYIVYARAET